MKMKIGHGRGMRRVAAVADKLNGIIEAGVVTDHLAVGCPKEDTIWLAASRGKEYAIKPIFVRPDEAIIILSVLSAALMEQTLMEQP